MGRAFEYRKAAKEKRWGKMSRIFPRLAKNITLAAKEGGPDPDLNAKLRNAINTAKGENMPKDNIDAAIKRASGKDAESLVEVVYEGKGPHGGVFDVRSSVPVEFQKAVSVIFVIFMVQFITFIMKQIILLSIFFFFFLSFAYSQTGSFTDPRDGQVYETITIGEQTWMAENLRFETEDSKELRVKKNKYVTTYKGGFGGAYECGTTDSYGTKAIACEHLKVVGRYYKWEEADIACPDGWHLSTLDEWLQLFSFVSETYGPFTIKYVSNSDLYNNVADYLKSGYWNYAIVAEDPIGFSMMPDGHGKYDMISLLGTTAEFWTSTPLIYKSGKQANGYYKMIKGSKLSNFMELQDGIASNYRSVRCVED